MTAEAIAFPIEPARSAEAVDRLLSQGLSLPEGEAAAWSVGRRLDALVALRLQRGEPTEALALRCAACGSGFEVELDLQACRQPVSEEPVTLDTPQGPRSARLPTGADQAAWQARGASLEEVGQALLQDPLHGPPDAATLDALGQVLAARDPLRELRIAADCPDCGQPCEHLADLEQQLVRGFAREQRALLQDIATLAMAFHWREADIVELPAWRRAFYLRMLEAR